MEFFPRINSNFFLFIIELKITTVVFQSPINLRNTDMEHMTTHLHLCVRTMNMNIQVYLGSSISIYN